MEVWRSIGLLIKPPHPPLPFPQMPDGEVRTEAACGNGPINAVFGAISRAVNVEVG